MKSVILVLLSSLTVVDAPDPEIICSSKPVEAVYDQDVILQCHLDPPLDVTEMTVEWRHEGHNHIVHLYQDRKDNPAEQREQFEGRTSLSLGGLTKGNLSLKLSSVRLSDTGRYRWSFSTEKTQKNCYVNLTVGESDVIGSHEPVHVTVGGDAILPCHLEPPFNVTTLTVMWKRDGKQVHIYRSRKDDLVDQDKNFRDRTSLFHDEMTRGNISLKLTNVTELDAGSYTCFVPKLHSQVRRGNVTLIVEPEKKRSNESQIINPDTDPKNDNAGDTGIGLSTITAIVICSAVVIIFVAGFAILWNCGMISTCAGRDEGGNNRENMEDREENNPDAIPLNNMEGRNDN